jgi:spore coat protein U-like protein
MVATRFISWLIALALSSAVPLGHARAASTTVQVSASVVKPLEFSVKRHLNFGEIILNSPVGTSTVSISMTGVVSCPAGLTCTGAAVPAILNVAGANRQTVRITTAASDLINSADGSRLRFTPVGPASVTLTNSGHPGSDFNVGGSIAIPATTTDGVYVGTVEVTVQYQ